MVLGMMRSKNLRPCSHWVFQSLLTVRNYLNTHKLTYLHIWNICLKLLILLRGVPWLMYRQEMLLWTTKQLWQNWVRESGFLIPWSLSPSITQTFAWQSRRSNAHWPVFTPGRIGVWLFPIEATDLFVLSIPEISMLQWREGCLNVVSVLE